jgi:hypothetical protein
MALLVGAVVGFAIYGLLVYRAVTVEQKAAPRRCGDSPRSARRLAAALLCSRSMIPATWSALA